MRIPKGLPILNSIAINTICGNEMKNIDGFIIHLESLSKDLFREIIIVDNSTDGCTEKLRDFAARDYRVTIISYKWNKNFGEARELAKKNTQSTHIFMLDVDDVITSETLKEMESDTFNSLFHKCDENFYFCMTIINKDENGSVIDQFMQPRIFPNKVSCWWEGRIHESYNMGFLDNVKKIMAPQLVVEHYGYPNEYQLTQKHLRNIDIMVTEERTPRILYHLGIAYRGIDNIIEGSKCWDELIAITDIEESKDYYRYCKALSYLHYGDVEEAIKLMAWVVHPEALYHMAEYWLTYATNMPVKWHLKSCMHDTDAPTEPYHHIMKMCYFYYDKYIKACARDTSNAYNMNYTNERAAYLPDAVIKRDSIGASLNNVGIKTSA